jgi:isocitrate/methylisocitrate lyase
MVDQGFVRDLEREWTTSPRWRGIERPYTARQVERLRGTVGIEHSLAKRGASRLWELLQQEPCVPALSALSGGQAVQEVRAGLRAIYVSGWQVAAEANGAGEVYPDLSLYPCTSAPELVRRVNNALLRADQIHHLRGEDAIDWLVPVVADAEAGFGGALNSFELMKAMIAAGAAGVHFEDQLSAVKKCGHMGGKVLVPTKEFIGKLVAARLAADVCGVDTLLIARTDARSADLLTNDVDPRDRMRSRGERTPEGYHRIQGGLDEAVWRAIAYAPYADLLWFETNTPDLAEAEAFARQVHARHPGKLLAYNCSPSFNWKRQLDEAALDSFQKDLAALGYRFQFITLSGFHSMNYAMFRLARDFGRRGMSAYADLQQAEMESEPMGYEATRHQEFVGTGYFDEVMKAVSGNGTSTAAMEGSTERAQFNRAG